MLSSPKTARSKGVTLIEVLVAMVVMSIGMLGIAGLQAATTKFQQGSRVRGLMAPLLSDIANRVRSNAEQAGNNASTGTGSAYPSAYVLSDTWATQQSATLNITTNCETGTTNCSTADRVTFDMTAWRQRVRAAMPQGAALLEGDRTNGFQVTFMWFDKQLTDKGNASDSVLVKSPVCSTAAETAGSNRMGQQNCCPAQASTPEGVRCNRFSFIP